MNTEKAVQIIQKIHALVEKGNLLEEIKVQLESQGFAKNDTLFYCTIASLQLNEEQEGTLLYFRQEIEEENEPISETILRDELKEVVPFNQINKIVELFQAIFPNRILKEIDESENLQTVFENQLASLNLSKEQIQYALRVYNLLEHKTTPVKQDTIVNALKEIASPQKLDIVLALLKKQFQEKIIFVQPTRRKTTTQRELTEFFIRNESLYDSAVLNYFVNRNDKKLYYLLYHIPNMYNLEPIAPTELTNVLKAVFQNINNILIAPLEDVKNAMGHTRQTQLFEKLEQVLSNRINRKPLHPIIKKLYLTYYQKLVPFESTLSVPNIGTPEGNSRQLLLASMRIWFYDVHKKAFVGSKGPDPLMFSFAEKLTNRIISYLRENGDTISDFDRNNTIKSLVLLSNCAIGKPVLDIRAFINGGAANTQAIYKRFSEELARY